MSTDRRRRALTISPYGTKRPNTGGTKRIHYLNRGYAAAGWEIYQISNASVRTGVGGLVIDKDNPIAPGYVEGIYFNPALLVGNRLLRQLNAPQVAATLLPRPLARSRQVARGMANHHVVIFEHPQNWDLAAPYLRDDHFVVLDAHNIEWRIWMDRQGESSWAGKAARALYEVERRAMRRANLVITCSDLDHQYAIDDFGCDPDKVMVAPNGVDCASFAPIASARAFARRARQVVDGVPHALFIGSNWGPNIDAARAVIDLASRLPEIHFDIVGSVGDALRSPFPDNVTVTGGIGELDPYFIAADIALNPMTAGSGSNVKMFEYLAAGLPIVTTPFGGRGVEDSTGLAILIAEMDGFPSAIRKLVAAPDLEERSRAARQLAEERYDWGAIAQRIVARIEVELGW
ncbi:glycosyltransferase family 4 protein [Sphingomonas sp.]|uniref:glycosyltransferase family 4 protein n=1 Tax=Sphingomonas sp. TaxID=28214 RepID=UPI0025DD7FC3|nr:glycosyltransferase family 4 protein [Sphingomonas sp.]